MRVSCTRAVEVPYHEGIAFEAVRGETRLTLFATVHVTDPRVFVPDEIAARICAADLLLVELTSDVRAGIERRIAEDQALVYDVAGPGLKSRLTTDEWETLQDASSLWGMVPDVADKMRPWFASLNLATVPSELAAKAAGAEILDGRVEALARAAGVAVGGLDRDPEELLTFFTGLVDEEELDLLRLSIATYAADVSHIEAMIAAWNEEEIVLVLEALRDHAVGLSGDAASVYGLFDRFYETLIEDRNRDWMTTILEWSTDRQTVVVAVGALHLPGEGGLLRLLEREGFAIRRLSVF